MNIDLTDTTSAEINNSLVLSRRSTGTPAVGMVLTLVIVTDEAHHYDAVKAASEASREHPARILAVIKRPGQVPRDRATAGMDAEVHLGGSPGIGETMLLRLHGELASHASSVVLPLLLPDAPVVVWWPEEAPLHPAQDSLGRLAQRRVTDAGACADPVAALELRAKNYSPGDTDLSWTRITPWRSVLAAALDTKHARITAAVVEGEAYNPSCELLALWLAARLAVPVQRVTVDGSGVTGVRLNTVDGEIRLEQTEPASAVLAMPGQPDRMVALKRRSPAELVAEELRRLDPDEAYAATIGFGAKRLAATDQPARAASAPAVAETAAGRRDRR